MLCGGTRCHYLQDDSLIGAWQWEEAVGTEVTSLAVGRRWPHKDCFINGKAETRTEHENRQGRISEGGKELKVQEDETLRWKL